MSAIQKIFQKEGPAYLSRYGERMPEIHKKVMKAVMECGSGSFGTVRFACEKCGETHELPVFVPRRRQWNCLSACGNRHCPTCQIDKANQWLES